MNKLPYWHLVNPLPSFHDAESGTVIEMTAKVYGAMNDLIAEYNAFAEKANAEIDVFEQKTTEEQQAFLTKITKTNREFFSCMKEYVKKNVPPEPEIEQIKNELIGSDNDDPGADTINGAKNYAYSLIASDSNVDTQTGSIIGINAEKAYSISVSCKNDNIEDLSTETVIVTGKNLLKNIANDKNTNGLTFLKSEAGVSVYGTATANAFYYPNENIYLPAGEYRLTGCPAGGSSATYYISVQKVEDGATSLLCRDFGDGIDFTVPENVTLKVFIGVVSGQTVDLTFKPMIELKSVATNEFEAYSETIYAVDSNGNVGDIQIINPVTVVRGSHKDSIVTTISEGINKTYIDLLRAWKESAHSKIDNLFKQATNAPMITFIDDDTVDLASVELYKNTCDELGIKGGFAVVTSNLDSQPELAEALKEYEKEGFHMCLHCDIHDRFYAPDTRDIEQCESDIVAGIRKMKNYQFADPLFWCIPYGGADDITGALAKKWGMECLVASGCNSYETTEAKYGRFALRRCTFNPVDDDIYATTLERLKQLVRMTVAENGWLLITTHFAETEWQTNLNRFKEFVNYAISQGMQVKTLNEAYRIREPIYRLYETF